MSAQRILLLIPQLSFGGAERMVHNLGQELARAGHTVTECVFESWAPLDFPTQNQLVALDVPIVGTSPLSKIQVWRQRIRRLRQLKQELRITVCISHLEGADYLNLLSRGEEQVLVCVHNSKRHDPAYTSLVGQIRRRLLIPLLYQRADHIVAVSRELGQEMTDYLRLPPSKVHVIPNFINLEEVRAQATAPLPPAAEVLFATGPVLVTAGRLAPEKNQVALLGILVALRRAGQSVRLLLLGDGPERPALVSEGQALGLRVWDGVEAGNYPASKTGFLPPDPAAYDVLLAGFQANPAPYVARAAVSVLPSRTEGFPLALLEALACSVPVASSDCPAGPREILAPGTTGPLNAADQVEWAKFGLLLPVPDPAWPVTVMTWQIALTELLTDTARHQHYRAQALGRACAFGPNPALANWEAILTSPTVRL